MEKTDDTVQREMVMVTLRWMGVLERHQVDGRGVQRKGRDFVGPRMLEELSVNIRLTEGSSLSPLMFIMVIELVSRRVKIKRIWRRMLYADNVAVMVESKCKTEELGEWEEAFGKHGLKMSVEMSVSDSRENK